MAEPQATSTEAKPTIRLTQLLLDGRHWDTCVDVSGYLPRLVGAAAGFLRDRVGRYVYVSTISVYADLSVPRDETGPLATLEDETTEEIWRRFGTRGA